MVVAPDFTWWAPRMLSRRSSAVQVFGVGDDGVGVVWLDVGATFGVGVALTEEVALGVAPDAGAEADELALDEGAAATPGAVAPRPRTDDSSQINRPTTTTNTTTAPARRAQ